MEYGLVAVWLVAFLALWLAGLPITAVLLRRLPGRGAGVAPALSLSLVTVVALWVGRLSFGWPALGAGLVVLVAATVAAGRYGEAKPNWRIAGETFAVFSAAFLFLVAVRAVDPAVHPILGEKFLDFGMVRTVLRAEALPPEDFWFAGEPVAYYYGGHLAAGLLALLTGTAAGFAYNLALAGFYAMFVAAAYDLGGTVAELRGASRRTGALFAAFFVAFASNLEPVARLVAGSLPEWLVHPIVGLFVDSPPAEVLGDGGFTYWEASRVIPGTINEFPLFAWLNGDLHAHMMSPAFTLVLVALLFAYFRTPSEATTRRRLLVFGAAPVVGGLIAAVNTWSFPSVMGLSALALLFAEPHPATLLPARVADAVRPSEEAPRLPRELSRVLVAGVLSVGVLLLAVVWALPFLLGPASTRGIGLFPDRSGLGGLLLVHGAFLLVATLYLLDRAPFGDRDDLLQVLVLAVGAVALSAVLNVPAVGLFVPPIVGAWVLLRRDVDVGFELVLLVAGLGLALLVEFVYVIENAGPGRFNTVFKLYAQVWAFLAIASGGMVAVLFSSAGSSDAPGVLGIDRDVAVRGVVAVLVFSTSLYGAMALPAHFAGDSMYDQYQTVDDPTLDATAFLKTGHPEEAEAIRWLDRTVEGQPNIVTTAPAGYYWRPAEGDGAAAAASLTGIPTVAGWNHAADFQGHEAYDRRVADVNAIYTGDPAEKAELLARYDVEYVYVGPAERANHGRIDYEGVDCVGDPEEFGEVLLYPVDCG